jgi:hypothetical protein
MTIDTAPIVSSLIDDIEDFLLETGLAPTMFGYHAMNDPSFVPRLRLGRDVLFATETKARRQMDNFRKTGVFADPRSFRVRRATPRRWR